MTRTRKIFLASAAELADDRREFELFIGRKIKAWREQGVLLELVHREDFPDPVAQARLQDEYKRAIRDCDVFVLLFSTSVGRDSEEEFDTAFAQFRATGKPLILSYFRNTPTLATGAAARAALQSLWAFQDKLAALGHFPTEYQNIDQVQVHCNQQLDPLAASGFGEAPAERGERAATSIGGDLVQGDQIGTQINTGGGAAISGPVEVGGHFIGRDFVQIIHQSCRGDDRDEASEVIAHYVAALASDLAGLSLGEIDVAASETKREPLQLADVYVPLDTHLRIPVGTTLAQWLAGERQRTPGGRGENDAALEPARETRPVSALEALAQHRQLTLLGAAGSGKSTFASNVLLTLALVWQGRHDRLADLGAEWSRGALLPIRIVLRRFAEHIPPGKSVVHAGDLWAFVGRELEASGYGLSTRTLDHVQQIARRHGALIVLDGLDECGSGDTRQRVLAAVDELKRSAGAKCCFLLTARPYAWPGAAQPAQGVYALAELTDRQIERFIGAWYAALVRRKWLPPGEAERKKNDLLAARQHPDLLTLARNPLLLTLMATLHANRGRLPDDRADLYNDSVELLLLRWNRQIGADRALLDELAIPTLKLSDLREVLEELAFTVHQQSVVSERVVHADYRDLADAAAGGTADIGEDRLIRAFRPLLGNSRDKAAVVVDYIEKRAGLLICHGERDGERQFAFPHRTFQEFLAACHLAAKGDFPAECARLARQAPGHWQVVLPLAARLAKAERGASAADELIGSTTVADWRQQRPPGPADWTRALLAGLQLLEIGVGAIRQRARTNAIATRVADWLAALLAAPAAAGGLPAQQRAYAGDVLAQLGDPRAYRLEVDPMRFVAVPRGAFWMGEEGDPHAPLHRNETLDYDYWIAEAPVTVAQFAQFVAASGYQEHHPDALRDPHNRPVVRVSWHDARAFCAWLTEIWRDRLPAGGSVSLPSEAEWEKAARGGLQIPTSVRYATIALGFPSTAAALQDNPLPRRIYPWGNGWDADHANAEESIGNTSTPGCFAAGRSPYGCEDMIGNVWEWTRSLWGTDWGKPDFLYPYDAHDVKREDPAASDDVWRLVRGGSWPALRDYARCAYRYSLLPGYGYVHLGFRVVLRSSPVS